MGTSVSPCREGSKFDPAEDEPLHVLIEVGRCRLTLSNPC
jgi:hypothetical protein